MKKTQRNRIKIYPNSPAEIIKASAKIYSKVFYNDEYFTPKVLAEELGIEEAIIYLHFGSRAGLLIEIVNYVHNLCRDGVFSTIEKSQYKGIKRVVYFLKLVHRLLAKHPECAYWFKAYFASDVVLTEVYPYLLKFYESWRYVVNQMLKTVISAEIADKIAAIYVDLLKACLLNDNGESGIANLFPSKFFLFNSVKRVLHNSLY